jgi:hypothetical protein
MTDSEPRRHVPDVWEAAFAWCPPSGSPLLGAGDTDPAGVARHPTVKRRRHFRFRSKKQPGDAPHRQKDGE